MNLLFVFGTRPEAIKLIPLIIKAKKAGHLVKIVNTKQQDMAESFINDFGLKSHFICPPTHPNLKRSLANNLSKSIINLSNFMYMHEGIDYVIVQGDTSSTLAGAMAGFYEKVPVVHIEAGLRTYKNDPFPEEAHRRIISTFASHNMCAIHEDKKNLLKENVTGTIDVVGNTCIDTLRETLEMLKIDVYDGNYVLITLHRRESFDKMPELMKAVNYLANTLKIPVKIPVHTNPIVQEAAKNLVPSEFLEVLEPQPYFEFVKLMAHSKFIVTDSGGLQEEGPYLGKRVLVVRDETERTSPKTDNKLIGTTPCNLAEAASREYNFGPKIDSCAAYGDGHAADRILALLEKYHK